MMFLTITLIYIVLVPYNTCMLYGRSQRLSSPTSFMFWHLAVSNFSVFFCIFDVASIPRPFSIFFVYMHGSSRFSNIFRVHARP